MKNNNKEFDPMAWANPNIVNDMNSNNTEQQVKGVVDCLVSQGIDMTDDYNDWLRLGFALADELGEEGRQAFHDLSRMNPKYRFADCDKQFDNCLRSHREGVTIATFFHMAKKAGIDIADKKDKCPTVQNTGKTVNNTENVCLEGKGTSDLLSESSVSMLCTFSDKLQREDLPSFLWDVFDNQDDAVGRDKMLLGTLNVASGLLPRSLYGIYDRRKVYAALYNIIYGQFATSKGELEAVRHIATPVKNEMRRHYEAQRMDYEKEMAAWEAKGKKERGPEPKEPVLCSPFISANSSASAVYRDMDANGGSGIIYETEADTLTNMLSKSEYGDYSDFLRKAHHHETTTMRRVSEHIFIEIDAPKLAVFLTCTGSQLALLLPPGNIANGLASRFLVYALPKPKPKFRNVFDGCDSPIEDIYKQLGEKFLPLYHALQQREEHPIQFILSKAQQNEFVETFDAVLHEQFYMLGDGIQGFIFRIALECFRYAMVLTALRRLSEWDKQDSIFDEDERALVCDDRDFHTAMTIINCLVNHTGRVYSVLGTKDTDPFNNVAEKPSAELKRYFEALPGGREFKTSEAEKIAQSLNINERTARRYLGDMVSRYMVLAHPKHGIYEKLNQ